MFFTKKDRIEYNILKHMYSNQEAVGSWILHEELIKEDIDISVSSVGRILKRFESEGLVRLVGSKGRVITEKGKLRLQLHEKAIKGNKVIKATNAKNKDQILDLLFVRRGIEKEAAGLAAQNASEEHLQRIRENLSLHENISSFGQEQIEISLKFHHLVSQASGNRMIKAIVDLILEYGEELEKGMQQDIYTDVAAHKRIYQEISQGSSKKAEKEMVSHINDLIQVIKEY